MYPVSSDKGGVRSRNKGYADSSPHAVYADRGFVVICFSFTGSVPELKFFSFFVMEDCSPWDVILKICPSYSCLFT